MVRYFENSVADVDMGGNEDERDKKLGGKRGGKGGLFKTDERNCVCYERNCEPTASLPISDSICLSADSSR